MDMENTTTKPANNDYVISIDDGEMVICELGTTSSGARLIAGGSMAFCQTRMVEIAAAETAFIDAKQEWTLAMMRFRAPRRGELDELSAAWHKAEAIYNDMVGL
jgi:hypothetical protein